MKLFSWCSAPNVVVQVRYAGSDREFGSWGNWFKARAGHLRIDIQDSNPQLLEVDNAGLL